MIPIFKPFYDHREESAVIETLRSGWVGLGPKTEEFEKKFSNQFQSKFSVNCNSATSALLICAKVLGVEPGDEVIIPTMTFISTAHIVCMLNAKPVFCDINENNLMLNWDSVKKSITPKTKLIIPVSHGGQPFEEVPDLGIPILYDCAHAAGPKFNASNKLCSWSFHAVKNLATGDGGMITTDDEEVYHRCRKLRWLGIDKDTWSRAKNKYQWDYDVKEIGYKAHGNDILSSIGIVQLEKLKEGHEHRLRLVSLYNKLLDGFVEMPTFDENSAWHLYVIRTNNRNELSDYLAKNDISSGVHYKPIHLYDCYKWHKPLPVAESVWQNILTLPLYPALKTTDVEKICCLIKGFKNA